MGISGRKLIASQMDKVLDAIALQKGEVASKHLQLLEESSLAKPLYEAYLQYARGKMAKNVEVAMSHFHKAHHCFDEAGEIQGAGVSLLNLSHLNPNEQESLKLAEQALDRFNACQDEIGIAKARSNIGVCSVHLQDYERGCTELHNAIQLQLRLGDVIGAGVALLNLSACYQFRGDLGAALKYAMESAESLGHDPSADFDSTKNLETYQWRTFGWIKIADPSDKYLANAYINLGNSFRHLGESDKAIATYSAGHKLMQRLQEPGGEATVLNQIGEVLREKGDYREAEYFYRRSKELFEEAGIRGYEYAVVLQSTGEVCSALRRFGEAEVLYNASLAEFHSLENKNGEAEVLLLMGESQAARENYRDAVPLLMQGLEIAQSVSASEVVVRSYRALGSAMMHIESERAKEYLSRALLLSEEHGMKIEQQNIHRELSSLYKIQGHSTDALLHFEKFYAFQRELYSEEADRRLKNLEILHKIDQYRRSLADMEERVGQMQHELELKTRELVSLATSIMKKREFVSLMEKGLKKLISTRTNQKNEVAQKLLKTLYAFSQSNDDEAGEKITQEFLSVHHWFAERLLDLAPSMSAVELKVCVLARMAMTAKQIAEVLAIAPKTTYNHQQDIRKKLNLTRSENLKTYLLRLGSPNDNSKNGS